MKEHIATSIRGMVSPSMRYELRMSFAWLKELLSRTMLWNWEVTRLTKGDVRRHKIIYIGRKARRDLAIALLIVNQDRERNIGAAEGNGANRRLIVSEIPFPSALCVPGHLNSIVPLGRPIEEITSNFHSQLRRDLKKNRPRYRLQQVLDSAEIERVDREMLRPYATARHGFKANQVKLEHVKNIAQKFGRLDLLLLENEVVGCLLGCTITRAEKRYWNIVRCGYKEVVFSDPKRWREANSINLYLGLEWAVDNGFDYYDMGISLARPGDGLLEWKRRRGGELDTMSNCGYIYIRPPRVDQAQFFWDTPLFAVEHHKLTLHLGLPDKIDNDEVASRYREMCFGGLFKVYLHCAKPPSVQLIETLRGFYAHQKSPPAMEIISST